MPGRPTNSLSGIERKALEWEPINAHVRHNGFRIDAAAGTLTQPNLKGLQGPLRTRSSSGRFVSTPYQAPEMERAPCVGVGAPSEPPGCGSGWIAATTRQLYVYSNWEQRRRGDHG